MEAAAQQSPFHAGESLVQTRLGVRDEIEPWARKVVRGYLPEQHRAFYEALPFLVAGARDRKGRPWATILAREPGQPGFMHSPDPATLEVRALPTAGDALASALSEGADIGLLGIELHTRRRNRLNGRIAARSADGFTLAVEQAFGNCPQYIHDRRWRQQPATGAPSRAHRYTRFEPSLRTLVEEADTFFIATGHRAEGESPTFGMDVSHRGGEPGFVRVKDGDDRSLVFPDYAGNNHFNTLGNLVLDSRAGLLFVDFERGSLLQLTGRASVDWKTPDQSEFPGARRLVHFELEEAIELEAALPLRFDPPGQAVRELRVVEKVRESEDVTSFVFAPRDESPLSDFAAGQHLPLELEIPGQPAAALRTYSLSNAPGEPYRITVKRESQGLVSRHLHDEVEVGHILSSHAPRGDFTLSHEHDRPVVLVSAGVGLTPLVSMLHALAQHSVERVSAGSWPSRPSRPVWFVYGARDGNHHPLRAEVERAAASHPEINVHVAYSRPSHRDAPGTDYQSVGRIDGALLEKLVPGLVADFYLCGPTGFMASVQEQLEARGVPPERIRSESF